MQAPQTGRNSRLRQGYDDELFTSFLISLSTVCRDSRSFGNIKTAVTMGSVKTTINFFYFGKSLIPKIKIYSSRYSLFKIVLSVIYIILKIALKYVTFLLYSLICST